MVRVLSAIALLGALGGCQSLPTAPSADVYATAAVAADHVVASEAGAEMLRLGGNAVDAAVATSFTLSVVRPYSCGIGGGGFMVIHEPAREGRPARQVALNYRETAPAAMGPDYYVRLGRGGGPENPSRFGPHAAGVPGTVAGLLHALEHYGTLDRATVLRPAIRAAEEGFVADASWVSAAHSLAEKLEAHPELAEGASYLTSTLCLDGEIEVGDRVRNPAQATALRRIAVHGRDGFYAGPVAEAIVAASAGGGGPITHADLAGYRVRVMAPLRGELNAGRTMLSMPPPSSGGLAMQQVVAMIARRWIDLEDAPHNGPEYVHLVAEAMKHAFADRAQWLADADFVDVPVERLLDDAYLDGLADSIDLAATRERFAYGSVAPAPDDAGTSHLSVVDADGMAVACTETINLVYGSLVVVPGFGFALNDEMDDFTTIPGAPNAFGLQQSDRNLPEPGKRPLSSMSPTIVLDADGEVELVAGASGGPRIISGTLQTLLNCVIFDMTAEQAVGAPRFHHQWMPEAVFLEDAWPGEAVADAMRQRGHEVRRREDIGVVQIVQVREDGVHAASDPRKGGAPAGY